MLPKRCQIGPKMEPKSDFGPSFSEFGEPLFLNNPPMVLAYFRGANALRHVQKACKKLTRRRGTTKNAKKHIFYEKMLKMGSQMLVRNSVCSTFFLASVFFWFWLGLWVSLGSTLAHFGPIFGLPNPILEPIWLQLGVPDPIGGGHLGPDLAQRIP